MFYDDNMRTNILKEQEIESNLRIAFERDEFVLYLQPQYDRIEGQLIGTEALVRWETSSGIKYSPADFIPMLEKNGLITKLDLTIFEKVCVILRNWKSKKNYVYYISVNLSRHDLYLPNFTEKLCGIADKYGIDHKLIHLEITETAYTENSDQAITVINKLRDAGFLIEMDDFGSGYSSLNSFKTLPIDALKIDMEFLSDVPNSEKSNAVVQAVLKLCQSLHIPAIAEGVETPEQAEFLINNGCQAMQGYLFSKPIPVEEFEKRYIYGRGVI